MIVWSKGLVEKIDEKIEREEMRECVWVGGGGIGANTECFPLLCSARVA